MSTEILDKDVVTYKKSIADVEKELSEGPDTLVIELCDTKPSSFFMDGPTVDDFDAMDKTAAISFPSLRVVRKTSRIMIIDKASPRPVYKKIRYIKGCNFIDMEKQIAQNVLPNSLADMIVIKQGHLEVGKTGDIGLYLYLAACEFNSEAKYRPEDAEDIFKVIDTRVDVEAEEQGIDAEFIAVQYMQSLKRKSSSGKGTNYNTDALEFLCSIFKLPSFDSGFSSEAWVSLAGIAKNDPAKFIRSIGGARALYESEVNQALDLGVISIDNAKAFLTDGGKTILAFDRDQNQEQKEAAMVDFFSNPKNNLIYEETRVRLKAAQTAKTSIQ